MSRHVSLAYATCLSLALHPTRNAEIDGKRTPILVGIVCDEGMNGFVFDHRFYEPEYFVSALKLISIFVPQVLSCGPQSSIDMLIVSDLQAIWSFYSMIDPFH